MRITVRQRDKGKKISLYLDIYVSGIRKYEYLKIYLKKEPVGRKLNSDEKAANKQAIELAEKIRIKRLYELQNNRYGILQVNNVNKKFIEFAEEFVNNNQESKSSYEINTAVIKHLKQYDKIKVQARDINSNYLEGFKNYLKYYLRPGSKKPLSHNTQALYLIRLKTIISEGCKSGVIVEQVNSKVKNIKPLEAEKSYLEAYELKMLFESKCKYPEVKRLFLFMCLTGLRYSDAVSIKSSNIYSDGQNNKMLKLQQIKTKARQVLPITEQAYSLIKSDLCRKENVFDGINYSSNLNSKLQNWISSAGIEKRITFHSARHTFATMNITAGTDIYTVSKLLGHKSVKTTEIYAKIIDNTKIAAVRKLVV